MLGLALLFFSLLCSTELVAQQSDYYYVKVDVLKVYPHSLGYMVVYRSRSLDVQEAYIPIGWFDITFDDQGKPQAAKAELIKAHGREYPYLIVYYYKGQFDHLKLYVKDNVDDPSWGSFPQGADVKDKFNVTDFKLMF